MSKCIPYPFYYDDMPVDISFVFESEKPAGKHGFLKVSGERFTFEDGTLGRFWGVNFNGGACFPSHDYAEKVALRLAKTGINIVRFHQLDAEWNTPNIFSFSKGKRIGHTRELHAQSMDRLDYLIHCLKDQGIYCYLDMATYRNYKSGDGVENPLELDDTADPYCYYNRKLIELQKEFIFDIWTHENPYTGLAYKDDPVFVMTEIINERDFFSRGKLQIELYVTEFRDLYAKRLKERGIDADAFGCDINGNDAPLVEFKIEVQEAYYREMYDYMRETGVKIPIAGTNWMTANASTKSNMVCDFMDSHTYFYDWNWGASVKKCMNTAITQSFLFNMENILGMRVLDRPMFVSEWDMPWPNEHRAESSVLYAAVGSLQGWAGWAIHTYSYGTRLDGMKMLGKEVSSSTINNVPYREGVFTTWNDPAKYGLFYHAALITRRGDVAESKKSAEVKVTDMAGGWAKALAGMAEHCKTGVRFEGQKPCAGAEELSENQVTIDENVGEIRSDTGELYRSWEKNFGLIDSPRTQCVYGFLNKNSHIETSDMKVSSKTDFAVIALSSLTDEPISSSDNLLLTTVGRAMNTGAEFDGDEMTEYGGPPVLIEVIEAEISIKTEQKLMKVWSVNAEGFFTGFIEGRWKDGTLTFSLGDTAPSMYYLLQKE